MIEVDYSKCSGCNRCMVNCSFFHQGKVSEKTSRINVLNLYEKGIDGPVVCQQCKERYCLKCPQDALKKGENGEIIYSATKCTGCGLCVKECPIGAIESFEDKIYVCDFCGGNPKCVEACPENALKYTNETEKTSLKDHKKENKDLEVDEKRKNYLIENSQEVIAKWRK